MDKFGKIKSAREYWKHCDACYVYWHDYITLNVVDFMISEIERLTEELEMSQRILENMTGGQDTDEILNI